MVVFLECPFGFWAYLSILFMRSHEDVMIVGAGKDILSILFMRSGYPRVDDKPDESLFLSILFMRSNMCWVLMKSLFYYTFNSLYEIIFSTSADTSETVYLSFNSLYEIL